MANQKGGDFERLFCRQLSLWWSGDARNDLFWRSAMSGGVATVTGQQAQAGDICSVVAEGNPLIDRCVFELKCGYPDVFPWPLFEGKGKKYEFAGWLQQAEASRKLAKAQTWALVVKRNRMHEMIFFPHFGEYRVRGLHRVTFDLGVNMKVAGYRLYQWMDHVDPRDFEKFLENLEERC